MNIKYIGIIRNGLCRVQRYDGMWNFMNKKGDVLFPNQWFKWVSEFDTGYAYVQRDDELWNLVNVTGRFFSTDQWFDEIRLFNNIPFGYIRNKSYFVDCKNKLHRFLL